MILMRIEVDDGDKERENGAGAKIKDEGRVRARVWGGQLPPTALLTSMSTLIAFPTNISSSGWRRHTSTRGRHGLAADISPQCCRYSRRRKVRGGKANLVRTCDAGAGLAFSREHSFARLTRGHVGRGPFLALENRLRERFSSSGEARGDLIAIREARRAPQTCSDRLGRGTRRAD